tara:strand:+ start:5917 stop:6234 length:318 start_codon:yes stop_codon:yes gene_type:complete
MSEELGKITEVSQDQIPSLVQHYIKHFDSSDIPLPLNELETVDTIRNDIKSIVLNTDRKKELFIEDIRSDLGKVIKDSKGVGVKRVEKPKENPIKRFLKNLFTKF